MVVAVNQHLSWVRLKSLSQVCKTVSPRLHTLPHEMDDAESLFWAQLLDSLQAGRLAILDDFHCFCSCLILIADASFVSQSNPDSVESMDNAR